MKNIKILSLFLILISCSKFVQMTDDQYHEVIDSKGSEHLNLLFSHNINGETHPCGCRQFPLGGLPQVNGIIKSEEAKAPTIYVDTGDTFFETTIVPSFIKQSSEFKARKIAEALDEMNLKIFTPGDQDFSMGEEFLAEISNKHKFKFLISNSSNKMKIKHQKLIKIDSNGLSLFFIGVVYPELVRMEYRNLFKSPIPAIKEQMNIIKNKFSHIKNKKIIVMSHSGVDFDEKIAKNFSEIDWIIGSHSQSFLRFSIDVNKAQLVQVLSRNHHLGKISLALSSKSKDKYELLESRDEMKNLIKNNTMISWLDNFKTQLDKVHAKEQKGAQNFESEVKIPTYISCSDCHTKQLDFWQETSHSIAFSSLLDAKAANNPSCVKCHSVGHNQEGGFSSKDNIVKSAHENFDSEKYWQEFTQEVKVKHPIRKLKGKAIQKIAKHSLKRDIKLQVTDNYSNVQCLNCHNLNQEHPFGGSEAAKVTNFKSKCIQCHTQDQSPEWYQKDTKGLATSLNQKYFAKKLKEVSCPKIE
jgi:hypothetical protein